MHKGHVDTANHSLIAGWAADTDRPQEPLKISILVDGAHVADVIADRLRPDLATKPEYGDGKHAFRYEFPEKLDTARPHRISVRYHDHGMLLPKGMVMLPAAGPPAAVAPALTPIMVTAPGRSGTTLIMNLLANAPEIVAAELVPLETRLIAYYAFAQHVLSQPADTVRSTHQDKLIGDTFHIGFNPFNSSLHTAAFPTQGLARDWADFYVPPVLDAAFKDLITEYYRRLGRDKGKPNARFFAEKNDNIQILPRQFMRRAFGAAREIIMVRDPRDVFCSHISYFKVDTARAFKDLSYTCKALLEMKNLGQPDVFFCVYETLLRGEAPILTALSEFLGTEIVQRSEAARQSVFARHATSANPAASVARWRTELPDDVKLRCNETWRPFLEAFGYPLA